MQKNNVKFLGWDKQWIKDNPLQSDPVVTRIEFTFIHITGADLLHVADCEDL